MWSCQLIEFASRASSSQSKRLKVQDYKHLLKLRSCFVIRKMVTSRFQQTLSVNSQRERSQYKAPISLFQMTHCRQSTMSEMLWASEMINGADFWRNRTLMTKHVTNQMTATQWCRNHVQLSQDAMQGLYTLYWVWDWPTSSGTPRALKGKTEIYTTCIDVDIVKT